MSTNPQLERYLQDLDKALSQISLSDRAEIITELKSHLLEAERKNPEHNFRQLLDSLGSPEQVASRYLMERGLKPAEPLKPRIWSPIIKWLTIGSLGVCTIVAVMVIILAIKFSPILKIDAANDQLMLLGGLISIDGNEGVLKVGDTVMRGDKKAQKFEGKKPLTNPEKYTLVIPFTNSKLELLNSLDNDLQWTCKTAGSGEGPFKEDKYKLTLDLSHMFSSKCEVKLPKGIKVEISGANAKMEIEKPRYHLNAQIANGKISLKPDPHQNYVYDIHVTNGSTDHFDSKETPTSYRVAIRLSNGKIENDY